MIICVNLTILWVFPNNNTLFVSSENQASLSSVISQLTLNSRPVINYQ
jgi:hypothetical protein